MPTIEQSDAAWVDSTGSHIIEKKAETPDAD